MLDEWEAVVSGEAERLKSYVYKALYGDMLNYCDAKVRWKKRQGMKDATTGLDTVAVGAAASATTMDKVYPAILVVRRLLRRLC